MNNIHHVIKDHTIPDNVLYKQIINNLYIIFKADQREDT